MMAQNSKVPNIYLTQNRTGAPIAVFIMYGGQWAESTGCVVSPEKGCYPRRRG